VLQSKEIRGLVGNGADQERGSKPLLQHGCLMAQLIQNVIPNNDDAI
jgi:hypothetical protein